MSLDPWDRRPEETDPSWDAFVAYRDQHRPRSLRRLGDEIGKDPSLVARWSSAHDWQERTASWDLEQDRQRREAMSVENVEAGKRHAQIAAGALQAAARVNLEFLRRIGSSEDAEAVLRGMGIEDLSELMVKVNRTVPRLIVGERLARGMTTESVELTGGADAYRKKAEGMTDGELDAFLLGAATNAAAGQISPPEDEPVEDVEDVEAVEID